MPLTLDIQDKDEGPLHQDLLPPILSSAALVPQIVSL